MEPTPTAPKEPTAEQLEFKAKLEQLIREATRTNLYMAGFVFGTEPPIFINFGNCNDAGDLKLYQTLCDFHEKQLKKGVVKNEQVTEVN